MGLIARGMIVAEPAALFWRRLIIFNPRTFLPHQPSPSAYAAIKGGKL
jgi:hypothetical protein